MPGVRQYNSPCGSVWQRFLFRTPRRERTLCTCVTVFSCRYVACIHSSVPVFSTPSWFIRLGRRISCIIMMSPAVFGGIGCIRGPTMVSCVPPSGIDVTGNDLEFSCGLGWICSRDVPPRFRFTCPPLLGVVELDSPPNVCTFPLHALRSCWQSFFLFSRLPLRAHFPPPRPVVLN